MAITEWSDSILIVQLSDEPLFSEEMDALMSRLGPIDPQRSSPQTAPLDVILDLSEVTHLNSSNLAQLLKLRKRLQLGARRLRICAVNDRVWTVLLITGLDGLFEFTEDVSTSLASLQIEE